MATMRDVLAANTAIAHAFETKFPILPKLSKPMADFAGRVPVGPTLPAPVVKVLQPPPPDQSGQPLEKFFTGAPLGPPAPSFGGTTSTATAELPGRTFPRNVESPSPDMGTILQPSSAQYRRGSLAAGEIVQSTSSQGRRGSL